MEGSKEKEGVSKVLDRAFDSYKIVDYLASKGGPITLQVRGGVGGSPGKVRAP